MSNLNDQGNNSGQIKRSRKGCHNCKRLKIKCDEQKPSCSYCIKTEVRCDYSMKLTWGGRPYKDNSKRKTGESGVNSKSQKPRKTTKIQFQNNPTITQPPQTINPIKDTSIINSNSNQIHNFKTEDQTPISPAFKFNDFDKIESPPSFPGGTSILSPQDGPRQEDFKSDNNNNGNNNNSNNNNNNTDNMTSRPEDTFSMLSSSFNITHGLENLSNALERVADGGHQFSLQNSEIFSRFLSSSVDDISSPVSEIVNEDNGSKKQVDDFLNNYSTDIAKIDAYISSPKSNLISELQSSAMTSFTSLGKLSSESEDYETDDKIVPLDLENSPSYPISPLNADQYFSTIPYLLIPLPELLNQVPYYRRLMHFWVNVASDNLVPAPSHIYKENPFKVILPQMAMEYPAILTTILAFAANAMALISGSKQPNEVVEHLISRSCNELLKMLKDKNESTSDATLATVLLLSCYELLGANNYERHRAHTLGARQIIMARKQKLHITNGTSSTSPNKDSPDSMSSLSSQSNSNVGTESDIAFFLMRWFVYVDVIGALSATKNSQDYLGNQEDSQNYTPAESVNSLNSLEYEDRNRDPKRDIDYILGFDVKFLPLFTDIIILIRKSNSYLEESNNDKEKLPISIITKAIEIKSTLSRLFEAGEARRQETIDKLRPNNNNNNNNNINESTTPETYKKKTLSNLIHQHNIVRCTNKLFCNMGILNLYRRVLQIPRSSMIIQEVANEIGNVLKDNIESCSSAEICTIFCTFCAACETLDPTMRQLFHYRFTKLAELGNSSAFKSLQIMTRCWETGEDWILASKNLGIDITLL